MNAYLRTPLCVALATALVAALIAGCETGVPDPADIGSDNTTDAQTDTGGTQTGGDTDPEPEPEPEPEPTILGEWFVAEGSLFPPNVGIMIETTAMILNDDGTGKVVARDPKSGIENCIDIAYGVLDDRLVLDYGPSNIPLGRVLTFELSDANTVIAFDQDGRLAKLNRAVNGLPPEQCQHLVEKSRFTGLPEPAGFGELEFDGTNLYYASNEFPDPYELRSVTAATGELNASLNISPPFATAIMNGAFWTHCACGGSQDATLRTPTMTLDTVVTTDLGHNVAAYFMAADEANGIVWIAGPTSGQTYEMLKVDVVSEPDVLLEAVELDAPISSLTYDGTNLWAVQNFVRSIITRMDPDTGEVLETWQAPDSSTFWSSVAAHEGRMFLLGSDSAQNGVIVEVELPVQP